MASPPHEHSESDARTPRPTRVGVVVSDRCDKTIGVMFQFSAKHPRYGKYVGHRTKLQAHDEGNVARVGDRVELALCRPRSKRKRWRLVRVIHAAPAVVTRAVPVAAPVVADARPEADA